MLQSTEYLTVWLVKSHAQTDLKNVERFENRNVI